MNKPCLASLVQGHDFSRADKINQINKAFVPAAPFTSSHLNQRSEIIKLKRIPTGTH
jgi:hypothetical protein